MQWYTCKSLLNTLGRAVEQLAVVSCPCQAPKQARVSTRGRSSKVMHCQRAQGYEYRIIITSCPV